MISVILVDDEVPALEELQYHLSKYPDVSVIDMYSNPMEAIEAIQVKKPDLIFLDIDMPFINGMELALKIQDINIETEIVFVTAHHEYSLQAFEVHALDYILKPIADERFSKTMARVIKQCNIRNDQSN
ncbi:MAG: response regulator, partial [Syntrophomonas sp.]|nr:response regulator [Syntrophomonas sp.]